MMAQLPQGRETSRDEAPLRQDGLRSSEDQGSVGPFRSVYDALCWHLSGWKRFGIGR